MRSSLYRKFNAYLETIQTSLVGNISSVKLDAAFNILKLIEEVESAIL